MTLYSGGGTQKVFSRGGATYKATRSPSLRGIRSYSVGGPVERTHASWKVLDIWQEMTDTILTPQQRAVFFASPHCRVLTQYWMNRGGEALRAKAGRAMRDGVLRLETWRTTP